MAEFPALPLWTDAYIADCQHLNRLEHGTYLMLLLHMWRAPEGKIPNDDAWLAKRLRCTLDEVANEVRPLIAEFCRTDGNWIWQKRLVDELSWVRRKQRKNTASAKSRWKKEKGQANASITHERSESERNAPTPTPTPTSIDSSLRSESCAPAKPTPKEAIDGKRRKTRIDPTWQPSGEDRTFAECLGRDADAERDAMVDWAIEGQITSADWSRRYRNWCRNSVKFAARDARGAGRVAERQGPVGELAAAGRALARLTG